MLYYAAQQEMLLMADKLRVLDAHPEMLPSVRMFLYFQFLTRLDKAQEIIDSYDD